MPSRVCNIRKLARAQAALIAVLYVFLSTFGTLTHSHVLTVVGADANAPSFLTQKPGSPTKTSVRSGSISTPRACAICEWQANNVSMALAPQRLASPAWVHCPYICPAASWHATFLARFSSRAPPPSSDPFRS